MPSSPQMPASTAAEAALAAGLSPRTLQRYVERGLLEGAGVDPAQLARIRRLTGLGVNLAGVEIILRMRAQIVELRQALARERQLRPWPRGAAAEGEYRVYGGRLGPPHRDDKVAWREMSDDKCEAYPGCGRR